MRCGILAELLARRGAQVTWWSSNFDHVTKSFRGAADQVLEVSPNLHIHLLPGRGYRSNVSLARIRDQRQVAAAFARRAEGEPRPDVIFSCLPTLEVTEEAVRFASTHRVPIVVDIRDLWPDAYASVVAAVLGPLVRLLIQGEARRARRVLRQATGLVAVSNAYLAWGLEKAGRTRGVHDGVFPLGYPKVEPSAAERAEATGLLERAGVDRGKTICCFVGALGRSYDLGPVITTARAVHECGDRQLQFVIAGDGERKPHWERAAAGLPNVVLTGWLSSAAIGVLMGWSAVALAAYAPGATQGLPNKVFEYLSAGLPILSSLPGETAHLLAQHGCGLSYRAGDAASFAAALEQLRLPERRREMGQNGSRCFEALFSTVGIYDALVCHIEDIAASWHPPSRR